MEDSANADGIVPKLEFNNDAEQQSLNVDDPWSTAMADCSNANEPTGKLGFNGIFNFERSSGAAAKNQSSPY